MCLPYIVRHPRLAGWPLACACVLAVLLSSPSLSAQQLAVVSRGGDVVVFQDLASGAISDSVAIGRFSHEFVPDQARRYAYTGSYRGNEVCKVDLIERAVRRFAIDGYEKFHGIVPNASGDVIWVTAEDSASILELDTEGGEILHVWPTGGARSHMVEATADGRKLYIGNFDSGSISVIDRETGATKIVPTANGTEGIDVSPDGAEVWVANRFGPTISILDAAADSVVATIATSGGSPSKLKFQPDGKQVWVSHHLGTTVTVFDPGIRMEIDSVAVGERPLALAFNEDGSRLYVSRTRADEIVEIDTATHKILRRIPTADNPDGIVWLP